MGSTSGASPNNDNIEYGFVKLLKLCYFYDRRIVGVVVGHERVERVELADGYAESPGLKWRPAAPGG